MGFPGLFFGFFLGGYSVSSSLENASNLGSFSFSCKAKGSFVSKVSFELPKLGRVFRVKMFSPHPPDLL